MPEPPDFTNGDQDALVNKAVTDPNTFMQLATRLSTAVGDPWGRGPLSRDIMDTLRERTAAALRDVWNARGAADIAAITPEDVYDRSPITQQNALVLKSLDR